MQDVWYWEYTIVYYNINDGQYDTRSGVVTAENITEAIETLNDFYGSDIVNIKTLRAVTDGVLEFDQEFETDTGKIKITKITDL